MKRNPLPGLPEDPHILVGYVNSALRSLEGDLEEFCDGRGVDRAALEWKLCGAGYAFDREHRCFRAL